jgi:putative PIG3 family NAD(P)H quinone oxidoreductase
MKQLPHTMQAAEIREQKLWIAPRPVPEPGRGEVLIRVLAAGVNRPDLLQRRGLYPPPQGVTDIPGLEIAGEIVAGAGKWKKGDKVCALVPGGGYAEYCTANAAHCLPLPKGFDYVKAAALPETFFTVWRNLFDVGHLKKGETVLIHGGASGIGTAAIQIAKAFGAKVFVTAGSEEKCKACRRLGASLAVNYRAVDFTEEVLKTTKGAGVDLVLDMVGGDYVVRNLKILAPGGRHVSIAMMKGRNAPVDLFEIMSRRLTLTGSTLRPQGPAVKEALAKALHKNIWPLLAKKKIAPVIDKVFKFEDAQAAHEYLEAGNHVGKIVLRM